MKYTPEQIAEALQQAAQGKGGIFPNISEQLEPTPLIISERVKSTLAIISEQVKSMSARNKIDYIHSILLAIEKGVKPQPVKWKYGSYEIIGVEFDLVAKLTYDGTVKKLKQILDRLKTESGFQLNTTIPGNDINEAEVLKALIDRIKKYQGDEFIKTLKATSVEKGLSLPKTYELMVEDMNSLGLHPRYKNWESFRRAYYKK